MPPLCDSDEHHHATSPKLSESEIDARLKEFERLRDVVRRMARWAVVAFFVGVAIQLFDPSSSTRYQSGVAAVLSGLAFVAAGIFLVIALLVGFSVMCVSLQFRIEHGRLRAHHFWKDDRPVPTSPGRRMLRVFGRIAKHTGLFGFLILLVVIFFAPYNSRDFLGFAMLGCVALLLVAGIAAFTDSFLAGLYEEDDEPELDDLNCPHEVAPESESDVDHDR